MNTISNISTKASYNINFGRKKDIQNQASESNSSEKTTKEKVKDFIKFPFINPNTILAYMGGKNNIQANDEQTEEVPTNQDKTEEVEDSQQNQPIENHTISTEENGITTEILTSEDGLETISRSYYTNQQGEEKQIYTQTTKDGKIVSSTIYMPNGSSRTEELTELNTIKTTYLDSTGAIKKVSVYNPSEKEPATGKEYSPFTNQWFTDYQSLCDAYGVANRGTGEYGEKHYNELSNYRFTQMMEMGEQIELFFKPRYNQAKEKNQQEFEQMLEAEVNKIKKALDQSLPPEEPAPEIHFDFTTLDI